jgi:hypothetical protein
MKEQCEVCDPLHNPEVSESAELAGCITGCLREYPERYGVYLKYGATELYFERHMAKDLLVDLTSVAKKWDSE